MIHALWRFYPVAAFFGGFVFDALTLGRRVRISDFWQLGAYLLGAALLVIWLAGRASREKEPPPPASDWAGRATHLVWQAPYLLLQFIFGSIFSALFILYFKSSGHLGAWLTAGILGVLLVANEFAGERYGRRFTLTWALLALNTILLANFVLPHLVGSLDPLWFYASTAAGVALVHGLRLMAPGRPGRILPAWGIAAALLLAWNLGMVAPVPLVKRDMAVGHDFVQDSGRFLLRVETAQWWQFWRDQAATVQVREGERLYGVSAVFAPAGVTADLQHRWEFRENGSWQVMNQNRFQSTGGRERGFRGYSWVLTPRPGDWRFIVGTADGRTIGILNVRIERGDPRNVSLEEREF